MKTKILLAAFLVASFFTTASAQDLTYGAKVGLNVANMTPSEGDSPKSLVGLNLGVTAAYSLNEKSAVSAELLFSQQGSKESESDDGYDVTYKIRLNYLSIPILYNFYIIDGLAVKAGIQPGFLLSGKESYEVTYNGETKSGSEDIEGANTFDFAIPVGVSYDITEHFVVDARYNIGVSNILEDSDDFSMRNNVFTISVGYNF